MSRANVVSASQFVNQGNIPTATDYDRWVRATYGEREESVIMSFGWLGDTIVISKLNRELITNELQGEGIKSPTEEQIEERYRQWEEGPK